ncbi:hypothetical protein [Halorhabdus sp. BNX81]|uniref:DUF7527 domain-containing protein n=1 Tax=Halorhabdus sp. BNX81 TaxID=2980181 RepID=UPI0023DD5EDE|nr:hypothetical protein [Halorhabdus sp. BNX81]WEL21443.1 Uncharacterized protein HBNXHr_1380 [Halorhabdus sp. BNX81]
MTTRAIERIDQWETRSFTGGYRGVHDLADREFSGVVRADIATLCMLNGAVVGVLDGTIEDFEEAEGTAYVAPTPALPLLIVMQERSDEVRAKYYTEDTPLSKVDQTLSDGKFTGFVVLSENVLSGDYYLVYHGGRSMSVAFVGERGELLTEQEAFERADGEVGIYEVRPVDIDVIDIPDPKSGVTSTPSGVAGTGGNEATETPTEADSTSAGGRNSADITDDSSDGSDIAADSGEEGTPPEPSSQEPAVEDDPDHAETPDAEGDGSGDADVNVEATDGAPDASRRSADTPAEDTPDPDTQDTAVAEQPRTDEPQSSTSRSEPQPKAATGAEQATERTQTETTPEETAGERNQADTAPATATDQRHGPTSDAGSTTASGTESRSSRDERVEERREAVSPDHPGAGTSGRIRAESTASAGSASDLEIRTIPSLDPERSWGEDENGSGASGPPIPPVDAGQSPSSRRSVDGHQQDRDGSNGRSSDGQTEQPAQSGSAGQAEPNDPKAAAGDTETAHQSPAGAHQQTQQTDERLRELEEIIDQREARIEDLEDRVETTAEQRDELKAERDELQAERDELREELSEVRSELASLKEERDSLQAQLDGLDVDAEGVQRRMSRGEAIDGTNLFVRYGSKSEPTLAAARESGASQSDVRQNLSVEYHTQFEVEGTHVEGDPFEAFLESTIEHQYVSWVVQNLLFEIRDTGHREALADLYDGLPHIDRVELNGSVGVEFTEDGQTKRSQESFDVVFRDRMGNPLIVANMNDSRQAATESQLNSLVTAATRVGETSDSLAGAMFVTSSFFEPAALETTAEATGGGLLSRDKRESFVKLSRKQGYHLCLVEARDDQFHMAVPEL